MSAGGEAGCLDRWFLRPWWVIDPLPRQAPAGGRYFAVEDFLLRRWGDLRQRQARLLLKLNCYYRLRLTRDPEGPWLTDPDPDRLADWLEAWREPEGPPESLWVLVGADEGLLTGSGDDLNLTLWDPSADLLDLAGELARSEGLFLWQPPGQGETDGS